MIREQAANLYVKSCRPKPLPNIDLHWQKAEKNLNRELT
jgi:hypothetical protein